MEWDDGWWDGGWSVGGGRDEGMNGEGGTVGRMVGGFVRDFFISPPQG